MVADLHPQSTGNSGPVGPYRVIQRLGAGGMGEVMLAHDDRLDRRVAIKRLRDGHAATPERRERFRREARILARLNHPAIVQIHDVVHQDGREYLVMEYVEGSTLRERCEAGPMTVSELLGIAHEVAVGMAAAHDLGIIHRDLKAENVLITRDGRGKLTDFGIAKLEGDDPVTADGAVIGTFRAMSPEQALGRPIDHRSDLFSFGVLLYEVLAGESPFRAVTPFLTMQRLVEGELHPIAELVPSVPRDLASLIHQLLAKEPLLRPRDFHEVADALAELADQASGLVCRARPSRSRLPSPGDDGRPTEDTVPPPRVEPPGTEPPRAEPPVAEPPGTEPPGTEPPVAGPPGTEPPVAGPPGTGPPGTGDDPGRVSDGSAVRAGERAPGPVPRASSRRRWYAAGIGVAVLAALGAGYALRSRPGAVSGGSSPRASGGSITRVAVLGPDIPDAGGPDAALLATAVRNAVVAELAVRDGLDLVPRDDIEGYVDGVVRDTGHPPWQSAIRAAVGADQILSIQVECSDKCIVKLTRDPAAPGGALGIGVPLFRGDLRTSASNAASGVYSLYPDHPSLRGDRTGAMAPQDHARFVQLVNDYRPGGGAPSSDAVVAEVDVLRRGAPGAADVLLFEADLVRHRDLHVGDRVRAITLHGDANRRLPDTYSVLFARFDLALAAGALDEASAVLDRLVQLDPDSSATHLQRARFHRALGQLGAARAELDAAARSISLSWRVLYDRARVLEELGDRTAARTAIDELLLRAPGNRGGLSLRAREEPDAGLPAAH